VSAEKQEQADEACACGAWLRQVRRASPRGAQEQEQGGRESRLRGLSGEALLSQMPLLQRLLARLVDCRPTGGAAHDPVVRVRRGCPALLLQYISKPTAIHGNPS